MKALLFAAGLGTRLKPLTDKMPKALVELGGSSLLEHTLRKLKNAGVTDVVVNIHHFGEQIIDFLNTHDFGLRTYISDEREMLLDTGGGLKKASAYFQNETAPILIHNVDILSNANLGAFYNFAKEHPITLLVSKRDTTRYLLFDDEMCLVGWTNISTGEVKSPYSDLKVDSCQKFAFSGIHTFVPNLIAQMDGYPAKFPILDFYLSICNKVKIKGYVEENLLLVDVGKYASLQSAEDFARDNGLFNTY